MSPSPITLPPLSLPNDAQATYPLLYTDEVGLPRPAPAGGTISADSASVAVSIAADGSSFTIASAASTGSANVSYADAGFTVTVAVTLATPAIAGLSVEQPIFAPLPAAPPAVAS
jgi:hypothetical protein